MHSTGENDDLHRYIEFLQRQLLNSGWDDFFDPHRMKTWLARNADKSEVGGVPQYDGIASPTAHLEKLPKTAFDSPQTQAILGPILERAKRAAEEINYASSGQFELLDEGIEIAYVLLAEFMNERAEEARGGLAKFRHEVAPACRANFGHVRVRANACGLKHTRNLLI
jgi:hypothetical protein